MNFTQPDRAARQSRWVNTCLAYPFANDRWSDEVVKDLRGRLRQQTTPKEKAAGLIIGSGGLPYILAHLGVSNLVVADLHEEVITTTLWRVGRLNDHDSWPDYMAELERGLSYINAIRLGNEFNKAKRGGLLGDFAETQAALATTKVSGIQGDILHTAPVLADGMRGRGAEVIFVNLTNAANYVGRTADFLQQEDRRRIIGAAIGALPLAEDAVIVDSSRTLSPDLYSVTTYPGVIAE